VAQSFQPSAHAPQSDSHCTKPTVPVLVSPGENQVLSNHYYGQGEPLQFSWLASVCSRGSIQGYRIFVQAVGFPTPGTDKIVTETKYIGDTTGTISARDWTWKVRAIDDLNQQSDWSEERHFVVGAWQGANLLPPSKDVPVTFCPDPNPGTFAVPQIDLVLANNDNKQQENVNVGTLDYRQPVSKQVRVPPGNCRIQGEIKGELVPNDQRSKFWLHLSF
jgi:hypothetical protein